MIKHTFETKFGVGDSVYGFIDGELHNLVIDRIELNVAFFGRHFSKDGCSTIQCVYLATTTDAKFNHQHRLKECELYPTQEDLLNYVKEYFEKTGDIKLY